MSTTLAGKSIAILAANGFEENHITALQRTLTKLKIPHKIIAPEQGLVNGWQDSGWGHYFTVDIPIGTAMGSDFDALVLVGGERAVAKLSTNLHARRIINHFFDAEKPVAAIEAGVLLLALSPKSAGREVAAPGNVHESLKSSKMDVVDETQIRDGYLLTSTGADVDSWVDAALTMFSEAPSLEDECVAA